MGNARWNAVVESAPVIREEYAGGRGNITGNFTDREAKGLAILMNTGALPVELMLVSEDRI